MCDQCTDWVHPECIKRDHADCPEPFFCPSCLVSNILTRHATCFLYRQRRKSSVGYSAITTGGA